MSFEHLGAVVCSFIAWRSVYFVVSKLLPAKWFFVGGKNGMEEFYCRVVTLLHAVLVVLLSITCIFFNRTWPFREPGSANLMSQDAICVLSIGYFMFDLHWCICHDTEDGFMLFHHIVSIICFAVTLYRGIYGDEVVAVLFATELTNPLLQLRWFLLNISLNLSQFRSCAHSKKRKTSLHSLESINNLNLDCFDSNSRVHHKLDIISKESINSSGEERELVGYGAEDKGSHLDGPQHKKKRLDILVIDLTFFTLFTLMRIVMGTIYFGVYQISPHPDPLARLGSAAIYLIGVIFWIKMIGYLLKNYFDSLQIAND